MVALRSRRLEQLLGSPLDQLQASHVLALVEQEVEEQTDLDYKERHYDRHKNEDLASDVAAMANTTGGLIILGIAEDEGRASSAPGVDLGEAYTTRIYSVVASKVFPLPQMDVLELRNDETPDRGFMVICVARSPLAPHAVKGDGDRLRYLRRFGRTTQALSEAEVASAYLDRHRGLTARAERTATVTKGIESRLRKVGDDDPRGCPWMILTLVPEIAADLVITPSAFTAFNRATRQTARTWFVHPRQFKRTSVGERRLLADDTYETQLIQPAGERALDVHWDGSCAFACEVAWLSRVTGRFHEDTHGAVMVSDEALTATTIEGLTMLSEQAQWAGAGGYAHLHLKLSPGTLTPRPLGLAHSRSLAADTLGRHDQTAIQATTLAALDDLAPGPNLLRVAARLLNGVANVVGLVELDQLTQDGHLNRRGWLTDWHHLLDWYESEHGS